MAVSFYFSIRFVWISGYETSSDESRSQLRLLEHCHARCATHHLGTNWNANLNTSTVHRLQGAAKIRFPIELFGYERRYRILGPRCNVPYEGQRQTPESWSTVRLATSYLAAEQVALMLVVFLRTRFCLTRVALHSNLGKVAEMFSSCTT